MPDPEFTAERVPPDSLQPHPRNYRSHPEDQLAHIIESIRENGIYRNIVVSADGYILAGHGVVEAALEMGLDQIPIVRLPVSHDDPQALKILTGDNEIARLGVIDDRALSELLEEISVSLDLDGLLGTGYDGDSLSDLIQESRPDEGDDTYTRKIEAPTYTPSDERPAVDTLYDESKTLSLIQSIEKAEGLDEEVRHFLIAAAQRHTVLNFERIADFYAHASPELQALMEESALVIIDFERAIELGFVQLTDRISEMVRDEYGE